MCLFYVQEDILSEAAKLYDGLNVAGGPNWSLVSDYMNGTRSKDQCASRWYATLRCRASGKMLHTPWTEAEVYI
jgi:hypothetical protein